MKRPNRPRTAFCLVVLAAAACRESDAPLPSPAGLSAPPPTSAATRKPPPKFVECAVESGLDFRMAYLPAEQGEKFKINLYDHGCGVSVADVDGDGLDDVLLLNQLGPTKLFRNLGGMRFEDVTDASGELSRALDGKITSSAVFADADGDGDQDLYVATARAGNAFLVNDGHGKFTDVTKEAGLELVIESQSVAFFDADGDADQDLLVTNTARWTLDTWDDGSRYWIGKARLEDLIASEKHPNRLYRNDGTGHFADVTDEAGMRGSGWGGDAAVFDYDEDGDLDVFVCNMFGASSLMANDGKGRFTDVMSATLGRTSWGAVGARAFDYDGDARLDLYVTDMHSDMWIRSDTHPLFVEEDKKYKSFMEKAIELHSVTPAEARSIELSVGSRPEEVVFGSTLYRNLGGGRFEETSARANAETFWPWGIAEGDYDLDGHVDVYIATGMGYPYFYWRAPLLHNQGDGTFAEVARAAGMDPPAGSAVTVPDVDGKQRTRSSRSAAVADFDGDGRLDIVVNNFNDRAMLFRNVSAEGRWIGLRLVGTKSGHDAGGAVARLTAGGRTQVRQVQAAGGYLAQSSRTLHFGLGDAESVDRIEITWPSGKVQVLEDPAVGRVTKVTEPE